MTEGFTPAQRKRLQRERDRKAGWTSVTVKVPADRVDDLKAFAASLGEPAAQALPGQQQLPFNNGET